MGQDTTHKLKKKRQKRYLKRKKLRIKELIKAASKNKAAEAPQSS